MENERGIYVGGRWLASTSEATVEVVDPLTLRFKFKTPWAGFTGVMANVPGYVMSAKALKEAGLKLLVEPNKNHAYRVPIEP